MGDEAMVALANVQFSYGQGDGAFSLAIPDLVIRKGERVACIGPSGSGKSTLVGLISGILTPASGTVTLGNFDITAASDEQRRRARATRIGMVFQEFELLEYLSAMDNILLAYRISAELTLTPEIRNRAITLAESTGVGHVLRRRPSRLSQGERQRIAMCRALLTEPELVMCDEPTGNLDPSSAKRTLDLLFEQVEAHDTTLLMVTHDHDTLARFDRVIDMQAFAEPTRGSVAPEVGV